MCGTPVDSAQPVLPGCVEFSATILTAYRFLADPGVASVAVPCRSQMRVPLV
ncbi:hypothetical protein D3C86_2260750 [compost metagenome]